jgi:hypothetical protein
MDEAQQRALWEEHRDRIVAEHVAESPGTRATRWWEFDAQWDDDETEDEYLMKLGLLLPGERERFAAAMPTKAAFTERVCVSAHLIAPVGPTLWLARMEGGDHHEACNSS